jgi:hypothetical protein
MAKPFGDVTIATVKRLDEWTMNNSKKGDKAKDENRHD